MKKKRKKLFKWQFFLKLGVAAVIFYVAVTIIQQQVNIQQLRNDLANVTQQCTVQDTKNLELQQMIERNNGDEYLEYIARRDFDYAKSNERVFMKTAGN